MKNPLNSMVINMEVLKRIIQNLPKKPGENAQKHIDLIVSEIKRLDKLCKNFLQFVSPPLPDFIEVDLGKLLKDVIFLIEKEALQRGIQIQQEVSASMLHLKGDPDQLAQAFLNLMMNALQAMAEGGTLKVEVENDEDWVEILIRDNGKGMSPEIKEKIFDLYFTTQEGGSGMGLPMARRIFDDHGGSIEVESKEGEGTTFNVWLPLKTDFAPNK
jgi:signal transduction histidine kinase